MLVHPRVTPSVKFTGTHLYMWVERGTMRVNFFAKNTTQCPRPGARTRTACFGFERTNHAATVPPTSVKSCQIFPNCQICARCQKDLKDNKHNCWFSVSRHSKPYRNKNQNRSIDKVRNLDERKKVTMQNPSPSDSGHNNIFFLGKICGEMFYPNLKL